MTRPMWVLREMPCIAHTQGRFGYTNKRLNFRECEIPRSVSRHGRKLDFSVHVRNYVTNFCIYNFKICENLSYRHIENILIFIHWLIFIKRVKENFCLITNIYLNHTFSSLNYIITRVTSDIREILCKFIYLISGARRRIF